MKLLHVLIVLLLAMIVMSGPAAAGTQVVPEDERSVVLHVEADNDVAPDAMSDMLASACAQLAALPLARIAAAPCPSPQGIAACPPHRPPD